MEHRGCRALPGAARSLPRLPAAPQPPAPRPCSFPGPGGLVQAASESPRRCQAGGEAPEGAQDAGRWFWEVVLGSRERLRRVSLLLIRSSPLSTKDLEHPRAWWWGWAGRNVFLRPGGWMGASCRCFPVPGIGYCREGNRSWGPGGAMGLLHPPDPALFVHRLSSLSSLGDSSSERRSPGHRRQPSDSSETTGGLRCPSAASPGGC